MADYSTQINQQITNTSKTESENNRTQITQDSDDNKLTITSDSEVIDILLSPDKTPVAYQRKLKELIEISGMTEDEARNFLLQPIPLELFYDYGLGLFGVESEAVDSIEICSPYTGMEIPRKDD